MTPHRDERQGAEQGTHLDRRITEHVNYPAHAPRHPSPLFTHSQHDLIVVQDKGCYICGVRHSDLHDPQRRLDPAINPAGAVQLEAHHFYIEDSLANAIDPGKFNVHLRPHLLHRTGNADKYGHDFTLAEMLEWIHGDVDALMILCDRHHRGVGLGAHDLTGPIWNVQPLIADGFDLTGTTAASPAEAAQLTALPQTTGTAQPPAPAPPTA